VNLEKFKEMPFSKKIGWIVQYYGVWIIVGIVAISVLCSFLHSVFFPDPIPDTNIIILSDEFARDEISEIEKEVIAYTGGTASVTLYNLSEVYGNGAFSIKLTTDQIDLVLAPKSEMDQMVESEYLESYEKLDYDDLYLGIPVKARKGEKLDKAIKYIKEEMK